MFEDKAGAYPINEVMSMEGQSAGKMMMPRTKLQRLNDMKSGLEAKLEEVNFAIKLLEENPKLTEIIDALEKVRV